jgi:3-oxoacyl-[acyl-carrier protein] reductase
LTLWNSTNLPEEVAQEMKKQIVSRVPANEMGRSEDAAKAASFLASRDTRYMCGVELFVDGGMASV